MAVCRVENYGIYLLGNEGCNAVHSIGCNADTCSYTQTTLRVLAGVGVVLELSDITIGDKAYELAIVINNGQLLNLVGQQHLGSRLKVGLVSGYDILLGHHLVNLALHIALEAQVAVGNDTDKHTLVINNGNTANLVLLHKLESITHSVLLLDGYGVVNHTTLGTLNTAHVGSLCRNRHILVDNADTALASQRNSKSSLGYGIHSRRHNGYVQLNITRESTDCRYLTRQNLRIGWYEQHIVKCETCGLYPFIDK